MHIDVALSNRVCSSSCERGVGRYLATLVGRMPDLTTVEGLQEGLAATTAVGPGLRAGTPDGTFCNGCGAVRRMHIRALKGMPTRHLGVIETTFTEDNVPQAYDLTCVQCASHLVVTVYNGPDGLEAVALPSTYGGLSTPNTPKPVAYYLDQAQRSHAVGAASAAIAMYRAALEQLLYHEGFTSGMLAAKIAALEGADPAPEWFRDLDPEFLRVMKSLGNGSIHPNDGDVDRQLTFDRALLAEVRALFVELLDDVYEQPARRATRLATMKSAAARVERGGAEATGRRGATSTS
jgi:nicotinamide mononucleotide (NMN) deamidase PncC